MDINPIKLIGNWDEGWALDNHVISSTYTGTDIYGHDTYNTNRSELGELLFYFKYRGKYESLDKIIDLIRPFLDKWDKMNDIDMIIPVPSSKIRIYQPATEIAFYIAEDYKINFCEDVLKKVSDFESKNMDKYNKSIEGKIIAMKKATRPHNILLVDDLYSTGSTLGECVRILKQDSMLKKIYVLTMTKTR